MGGCAWEAGEGVDGWRSVVILEHTDSDKSFEAACDTQLRRDGMVCSFRFWEMRNGRRPFWFRTNTDCDNGFEVTFETQPPQDDTVCTFRLWGGGPMAVLLVPNQHRLR